jgi:plasmid stabilization system protein ParE
MQNGSDMPQNLRLEWRPQARADLLEIVSYIAEENPDAAQALLTI